MLETPCKQLKMALNISTHDRLISHLPCPQILVECPLRQSQVGLSAVPPPLHRQPWSHGSVESLGPTPQAPGSSLGQVVLVPGQAWNSQSSFLPLHSSFTLLLAPTTLCASYSSLLLYSTTPTSCFSLSFIPPCFLPSVSQSLFPGSCGSWVICWVLTACELACQPKSSLAPLRVGNWAVSSQVVALGHLVAGSPVCG
uniref:Uncharacterized protein n=1 Tax=Sphaerodactylus townsendi TaxID=933632 RepID=A0ACB8EXR3_9SAUR